MMLLQKKLSDGTYYNFGDIQRNAYKIDEQPKQLSKIQYSNNKRRKFVTTTDDVVIEIEFSPRNASNTREYINNLTSGTYKYYSIKYNTIKENDFIVELPEHILESFINDELILEDFEIKLELGVEND